MEEEAKPKVFNQANGYLQAATQVGIATVAIHLSFAKSLPEKGRILLSVSEICTASAFLASLSAIVLASLGKTGRAARLLTAAAGAATACGFISLLGLILPAHLMFWIPFGFYITIIFAFVLAFAFILANE